MTQSRPCSARAEPPRSSLLPAAVVVVAALCGGALGAAAPAGGRHGRSVLSALQVGTSNRALELAPVPEEIATVRHKKEKGTGYLQGSPLYERQEALINATKLEAALAAKAKEEEVEKLRAATRIEAASGHPFHARLIESPGFLVWVLFLILGCGGIAAAIKLGHDQKSKADERAGVRRFPEHQPPRVNGPPRPSSPSAMQPPRSTGSIAGAGTGNVGGIHPALVPGPQPMPTATLLPPAMMDFAPVLPPSAGSPGGLPHAQHGGGRSPIGSAARLGPMGPVSPPMTATMPPGSALMQSSPPALMRPGSGPFAGGSSPQSRGASPVQSMSFHSAPRPGSYGR